VKPEPILFPVDIRKRLRDIYLREFLFSIVSIGASVFGISLALKQGSVVSFEGILTLGLSISFGVLALFTFSLAVRVLRSTIRGRLTVLRPPGSRLASFLDFLYSKKTMERVLLPAIHDMQEEYIHALEQRRFVKARVVLARGYLSVGAAVIAKIPTSIARVVYEIWKAAS
jgi:hypothetical protein